MWESWAPHFGITGKVGGHPDWAGRVGIDSQRVGLECGPLGGFTAVVPVTPNASWTWFVTIAFTKASRWHQETWSPPASVSRSSTGGHTLEETAA